MAVDTGTPFVWVCSRFKLLWGEKDVVFIFGILGMQ